MKLYSNFLFIKILMVSSIVLLMSLQFFWLKSAYSNAADQFRKETNILFRSTLFALHDSLIQRSIEPISSDSMKFLRHKQLVFERPFHTRARPNFSTDSVANIPGIEDHITRVEVFIASDGNDSVRNFLRPVIRKIHVDENP